MTYLLETLSLSKVLCKYLAVLSIVIFVLGKIYIFHMYCLFFITCLSFIPDCNTLCQNHNTVKKKKAWLFFVVKRETDWSCLIGVSLKMLLTVLWIQKNIRIRPKDFYLFGSYSTYCRVNNKKNFLQKVSITLNENKTKIYRILKTMPPSSMIMTFFFNFDENLPWKKEEKIYYVGSGKSIWIRNAASYSICSRKCTGISEMSTIMSLVTGSDTEDTLTLIAPASAVILK